MSREHWDHVYASRVPEEVSWFRPHLERSIVAGVRRSLKPGGHVVVATFGPHGPETCSGLDVMRYSPEELHAQFGADFARLASATERHVTPRGTEQEFIYCYCRMPGTTA